MDRKIYKLKSEDSKSFSVQFDSDVYLEKGSKIIIDGLYLPFQTIYNFDEFINNFNKQFFGENGKYLFSLTKYFSKGPDLVDPKTGITDFVSEGERERPCIITPLHDGGSDIEIKLSKFLWATDNDDFIMPIDELKFLNDDSDIYINPRTITENINIVNDDMEEGIKISYPPNGNTFYLFQEDVRDLDKTINLVIEYNYKLKTLDKYVTNLNNNFTLFRYVKDNNIHNFSDFYNFIKNNLIKIGIAIADNINESEINNMKNELEISSGAILNILCTSFFYRIFRVKLSNSIQRNFLNTTCSVALCKKTFNCNSYDDKYLERYDIHTSHYFNTSALLMDKDEYYYYRTNSTNIKWSSSATGENDKSAFYTYGLAYYVDSRGLNNKYEPIMHTVGDSGPISDDLVLESHAKCNYEHLNKSGYYFILNVNGTLFSNEFAKNFNYGYNHDISPLKRNTLYFFKKKDNGYSFLYKSYHVGDFNGQSNHFVLRLGEVIRDPDDLDRNKKPYQLNLQNIFSIPVIKKDNNIDDVFKILDEYYKNNYKDSLLFFYGENLIENNAFSQLNDYALLGIRSNFLTDFKNMDVGYKIKRNKIWLDLTYKPLYINIKKDVITKNFDIKILNEEGDIPSILKLFENIEVELSLSNFFPFIPEPKVMENSRILLIGQTERNGLPYKFRWSSNNKIALSFFKYVRLYKFFLQAAPEDLLDTSVQIRTDIIKNTTTINETYGILYQGILSTHQPYSLDANVDKILGTEVSNNKLIEYFDNFPSYSQTINSIASENNLDDITIEIINEKGEYHTWITKSPIIVLEIF